MFIFRGQKIQNVKVEQFWANIDVGMPDVCWLWCAGFLSNKAAQHYGVFHVNGVNELAHRLALSFSCGVDISSEDVLHSCDVPACCNPRHLRVGTHRENMLDMVARGRRKYRTCQDHPNSKLTNDEVRFIRCMHDPKASRSHPYNKAALARKFGVDPATIARVLRGEIYKDVV